MASSQDAWYLSLLGLAENFRTSSPPNIKLCIQCLQAVFNFKPPPRVEARTHLQLGNILLTHTKNIDLARTHLEQAWLLSQVINAFDDVKFEAASVLAELYEQQTQSSLSKPILRKAIELSQHSVYWHCRLIFQLAQIHASERDYELASSLLGVGVDYAHISNAGYTRVLFLLSRGMLLLIDKKFQEVHPLLNQAGHLVDGWQGSQHQKEYLKVFFLVLQVCHYLMAGQVKSVKPCLKQLQQSIQTIMQPSWPSDESVSGPNVGDMFIWMPKEHLYVLVYLVTVMHSMQAGYMDKAQKYTDKALMQIEKLKIVDNRPILSVFQLMLLEHIIMCRLVMGNKSLALNEISQACGLCQQQPRLLLTHRPQLHTLLGLYAMSMNCMEAAEAQFTAALRTSQERELWTFANLNLAIVYLRAKREQEFAALLERINPESLPSHSHSLRAAAYYVQGLQSFFQARYNEAKRYLRETLKMANAEDLNRLTSCSLVLLGHIFLSLGNSRESMNMVTPAMQLASKIPDVHVQLWASAILKDLYRMCGDPVRENEAFQMHCNFSQMLLKDHFQASQMTEHNLIHWTEGNFPMLVGNPPSTSDGLFVEADVVCFRGVLGMLMCTPYENQEGWMLYGTKFCGTLYLCQFDTEEKKARINNLTERDKQFLYWGRKFEKYLCSDKPRNRPNPSVPVNENEELCLIFKSRLNGRRLLFGAEIDGVLNCNREIKSCEELQRSRLVELKTNRVIQNSKQFSSFQRFKLLKWWVQSYLVGIEHLVCGFRNDGGIVQELKQFNVSKIPYKVKNVWDPDVCMTFCDTFLDFADSVVQQELSDTVWKFEWKPNEDVTAVRIEGHSQYSFLPAWFTEKFSSLVT